MSWTLLIYCCCLTFTLSQSGEPPSIQTPPPKRLWMKKLEGGSSTVLPPSTSTTTTTLSPGYNLTTTTQLPMPADDNVPSVNRAWAFSVPEHRGSGKKHLNMTSQDPSGSIKAKKGVFYYYNFYYYTKHIAQ